MEQLNKNDKLPFKVRFEEFLLSIKNYLTYNKRNKKRFREMTEFSKISRKVRANEKEPVGYHEIMALYEKIVGNVRLAKFKAKRIRKQEKRLLRRKILITFKALFT
ncbi:MAG: hypothetical protein Q4E02_05840 [Lagierella massiliensis]|nr:hypothetical protein [Lagierella massiliensis]